MTQPDAVWDDSPYIDGQRQTVRVGDVTVIVHIDHESLLELGRHIATDDGAQQSK